MPNWKTHLEIGKRLNEKLNYNEEDYNMFLFGSILLDINNCYIVTDISKNISHQTTHFGHFRNGGYTKFKAKYENEIENKNPLFMGCLAHLYTDCTWNREFYDNLEKRNITIDNRDTLRIMKQSDFKVYNNKFKNININIKNINKVLEETQKIEEVSITKEDTLKVIEFLKGQTIYEQTLQCYKVEELDALFEKTIEKFSAKYI